MLRILLILICFSSAAFGQVSEPDDSEVGPQLSNSENISPASLSADGSSRRYPKIDSYYQNTSECPPFFWLGPRGFDLLQQCRVAAGTESMAYWAIWGIGISVIGVLLLFGTLIYTGRAANATRETLGIATKTLRQDRAWLGVMADQMDKNEVQDAAGNLIHVSLSYPILNAGQSPAINVAGRMRAATNIPHDFYSSVLSACQTPPFTVLPPGGKTFSNFLLPAKWIASIKPNSPLIVNVYIGYIYETIHEEVYLIEYESSLKITNMGQNMYEYSDEPKGDRNRITEITGTETADRPT